MIASSAYRKLLIDYAVMFLFPAYACCPNGNDHMNEVTSVCGFNEDSTLGFQEEFNSLGELRQ